MEQLLLYQVVLVFFSFLCNERLMIADTALNGNVKTVLT